MFRGVRSISSFLGVLALLSAACGQDLSGNGNDAGILNDAGSQADAGSNADGGSTPDGGLGVSCSGASPSFASQVHPILTGCGGEMCHGGLAQGAWSYSQLVNAPMTRDTCEPTGVIVTAGSLSQSYLINKLTGIGMCPGTHQMPIYGSIPSADLQTIADWICQGALNN